MKASLVVFVAVAVAAMASAAVVQDRVKRSAGGVRLKMQEARIKRLSRQVEDLENLLEEKSGGDSHDAFVGMQSRLDKKFGGACPNNEFSCAGLTRQCISDLEVCDGVKDCANGHDENDETCELLPATGSSWRGGRVKDGCTNRQPYEMQVVFTDRKQREWFGSRSKVGASVTMRSKSNHDVSVATLTTSGLYNFAARSLYLTPPEADGLGMEVVFDTGYADRINVYIVRESSGDRCAQFVLYRD